MVCSWLPLPSLLGLFGALLMVSPGMLSELPFTDPGVQHALAFAVQQYNQDMDDNANYFKVLHFVKAQSEGSAGEEYHLNVQLVETECKKKAGVMKNYKTIQKCQQLPGNQENLSCYFKVTPRTMPNLALTVCG